MKSTVCLVASLVLSFASPAHAARATHKRLQVDVMLGWGFELGSDNDLDLLDDANPYRFGLGARVGYTFATGLYIGAMTQWFSGVELAAGPQELNYGAIALGVDLGYDIGLGPMVLRPAVTVGTTVFRLTGADSEGFFTIAPQLQGIFVLGALRLGAELRFHVVNPGQHPNKVYLGGVVGMQF